MPWQTPSKKQWSNALNILILFSYFLYNFYRIVLEKSTTKSTVFCFLDLKHYPCYPCVVSCCCCCCILDFISRCCFECPWTSVWLWSTIVVLERSQSILSSDLQVIFWGLRGFNCSQKFMKSFNKWIEDKVSNYIEKSIEG